MATTRIMPLHIGKGRTESRAISEIIDYVANPQKTDHGRLIFDRPAFKEMMQDITDGKINCVIVKDLSRLGRE